MIDVNEILDAVKPLETEENSAIILELKGHLERIAEEESEKDEKIKRLQENNNKLVTMVNSNIPSGGDNNTITESQPEEKTTDDYLKSIFSNRLM